MDSKRTSRIFKWLKRIEASKLSIRQYFASHDVPFSRAQYFIYKRQLEEGDADALIDRRRIGNSRKVTETAEAFLKGCIQRDPDVSLGWLQQALEKEFGCSVSLSTVSRTLNQIVPERPRQVGRPAKTNEEPDGQVEHNALGGFEMIVAVAYHLGWPERAADVVGRSVDSFRQLQSVNPDRCTADKKARNKSGQFTKAYNKRRDVRQGRFASIEDKRQSKNWRSMNIASDHHETLARKCLAILSLPLITDNGQVRSVNLAHGQTLRHLCGFNYRQSSIAKFLAELKYVGASAHLLRDLPEFWRHCWEATVSETMVGPLLCFYIDGNTKAVWSSKRVRKNKVTMLGRVMGCLEQVFIHDGLGHPIYFETYSGHAPSGEDVLALFDKIEGSITEVPHSRTRVVRAIIMDGGHNSVSCLRAFAAQTTYHYVTTLDDNQWDDRRVRSRSYPIRYRYGDATLRDLDFELADSKEKGYLITTRAIQIAWDNGRITVLLTSIPRDIVDANEVVFSYFRRWPAQELQFKHGKAVASLNRVAAYGAKMVENPRQRGKQEKLAQKIAALREQLADAIEEANCHQLEIAKLIPKERRLRAKTTIRKGQRSIPASIRDEYQRLGQTIDQHQRAIKTIEKKRQKEFKALAKSQQEWLRLQGKETEYAVDVELDQVLTYFRASLVHLYAYFIQHFLDGGPISLVGLVHRVMHLPAKIVEVDGVRRIELSANSQDPKMMRNIQGAITKLNKLKIKGPRGRLMHFSMDWS